MVSPAPSFKCLEHVQASMYVHKYIMCSGSVYTQMAAYVLLCALCSCLHVCAHSCAPGHTRVCIQVCFGVHIGVSAAACMSLLLCMCVRVGWPPCFLFSSE